MTATRFGRPPRCPVVGAISSVAHSGDGLIGPDSASMMGPSLLSVMPDLIGHPAHCPGVLDPSVRGDDVPGRLEPRLCWGERSRIAGSWV